MFVVPVFVELTGGRPSRSGMRLFLVVRVIVVWLELKVIIPVLGGVWAERGWAGWLWDVERRCSPGLSPGLRTLMQDKPKRRASRAGRLRRRCGR